MFIFFGIMLCGIVLYYIIRSILAVEVSFLLASIAKEHITNESFYSFYMNWKPASFVFGSFIFSPHRYVKDLIKSFNTILL